MDMKFVALNHFIELTYNGILRRLLISFIRGPIPQPPSRSTSPTKSRSPAPSTTQQIFQISRSTILTFKPPVAPLPKKKPFREGKKAEGGEKGLGGYESIGGTEDQIEMIRELVEWPLTRPELYNHFGAFLYSSRCIRRMIG